MQIFRRLDLACFVMVKAAKKSVAANRGEIWKPHGRFWFFLWNTVHGMSSWEVELLNCAWRLSNPGTPYHVSFNPISSVRSSAFGINFIANPFRLLTRSRRLQVPQMVKVKIAWSVSVLSNKDKGEKTNRKSCNSLNIRQCAGTLFSFMKKYAWLSSHEPRHNYFTLGSLPPIKWPGFAPFHFNGSYDLTICKSRLWGFFPKFIEMKMSMR